MDINLKKLHRMLAKEFQSKECASKAIRWLIENHSSAFIKSIKPYKFIMLNELLWR